jgi:hypothetical protein
LATPAIAGDADYHAFLYDATAAPPMQDVNSLIPF